jgi:hypothetical protein
VARATWKVHEKHGDLTERSDLPDSVYAFPKKRKEPLTDASHVRNTEHGWNELGRQESTRRTAAARSKSAKKAATTRKKTSRKK